MTRATFANIRIKNLLVPDREGWFTLRWPDGQVMTIYDAATAYKTAGTPMIVLAGREYGTGSSRDWAAKGTAQLGIKAVIAESFERIHRANLVGTGVLPLLFAPGQGWRQLELSGRESFDLRGLRDGIWRDEAIEVVASDGERKTRFSVKASLLTDSERHLLVNGGVLPTVLRTALATPKESDPATSSPTLANGSLTRAWS
jgi:aconitate hydratase